jgi:hypothetical protein
MKAIVVFLLVALASCSAQTVTDELLAAQAELNIGHEFAEVFMIDNRARLSGYLTIIEERILDAFMVAYAEIKNIGISTREEMEALTEPSFCKDAVRARWELQVTRYGQKLSQCLAQSHR